MKKKIYSLNTFANIEGLVHCFSTVSIGNVKDEKSLKKLSGVFQIDADRLIGMNQVHGENIGWVTDQNLGSIIKQTDGIFTSQKELFLYGTFADCVPILFYDKTRKVTGIVHAGWKGMLSGIAKRAVKEMEKAGSKLRDIIVGIGPSIRVCCYDIDKERAALFSKEFSEVKDEILLERGKKVFLDLQTLLKFQLYSIGIKRSNIEDIGICTKENTDFYSYRRDNRGAVKYFAGVIGRKN